MTFPILRRFSTSRTIVLGFGLALLALPASAHVTIKAGPLKGGALKHGEVATFVLKIPHGCAGAATTGLRVAVPPVLSEIAPQEKPGWTVTVTPGGNGTQASVLAWSGGSIPAPDHAEFTFRARIADEARGRVHVPVVQQCGAAVERWIEIPAGQAPVKPGESEDSGKPAPSFDVGP